MLLAIRSRVLLALALGAWLAFPPISAAASRPLLETVRQRGHIVCGVGWPMPGIALADERGQWSGIAVDFCGALAAAVLGKRDAVRYRPLTHAESFGALKSGEIDVLMRHTSWTLSRDTELGARYIGTLYYDGLALMVPRKQSVSSVLELSGASVCVLAGQQGESSLADFFATRRMRFLPVASGRWEDLTLAYSAGKCTAFAGDATALARARAALSSADAHILLPELITREPIGPAVAVGDEGWFAIVRWTMMTLFAAEELGLTSANVGSMHASTAIDIRRMLGIEGDLGAAMGLSRDWAMQVIRQVGNYGEVFERNLGQRSSLRLDRGLNNLVGKGGLMHAPPFR